MTPTREAGLARLAGFTPSMGKAYAAHRNEDRGPGAHDAVSGLSLWLRHRLVTEEETAAAAVSANGAQNAEKFIQEVGWTADWLAAIERELAGRGIRLRRICRSWDSERWPHATRGCFAFWAAAGR